MTVTIDRAGRVVIPKEIRGRLGLHPDAELTIEVEGNSIRIAPLPRATRQFSIVDGVPVFSPVDGWNLTDADVQRLRDADQR